MDSLADASPWQRRGSLAARVFGVSTALAAVLALAPTRWASGQQAAPTAGSQVETPAVLVGAGDIADCDGDGAEATAALLDTVDGTVVTLGDNAYDAGTPAQFASCYDPTWGRHRFRTRPAPGNHEYGMRAAAGYFQYFGELAGEPTSGYYSYNVGAWHVAVLNSNCSRVLGCEAGSPQEQWLRADLAANPSACTLAYWHHPRFSSGPHGSSMEMRAVWRALYDAGADVVLSGHDHLYERFAAQDPDGNADPDRGIRQFVVGTGGASHYQVENPAPNSEVTNTDTFGVLKLTLWQASYEWEFLPVAGSTFTDRGTDVCR